MNEILISFSENHPQKLWRLINISHPMQKIVYRFWSQLLTSKYRNQRTKINLCDLFQKFQFLFFFSFESHIKICSGNVKIICFFIWIEFFKTINSIFLPYYLQQVYFCIVITKHCFLKQELLYHERYSNHNQTLLSFNEYVF